MHVRSSLLMRRACACDAPPTHSGRLLVLQGERRSASLENMLLITRTCASASQDPLSPLSADDTQLIWQFKHFILSSPAALPKFLQCHSWLERSQVSCIARCSSCAARLRWVRPQCDALPWPICALPLAVAMEYGHGES